MSTWDDWERWLHLGGVAGSGEGASRVDPLVIDDPWGDLDVEITPLTEAQRDHLRLAAPTLLDELADLGPGGGGDPERDREPDSEPDPGSDPWSDPGSTDAVTDGLAAAFEVLDAIEPHDDEG